MQVGLSYTEMDLKAMIRNIIFDFGGVLLDWNPRYLYRKYFGNEREMEYFLTEVCTLERNSELDCGEPFAEWVKKYQSEYPRYAEAIEIYHTRWPEMLRGQIPEGVALLRDMKSAGYGIYGLTNWSAETIGYAYEAFGDLKPLFDGIVVSGEEKTLKPGPEIYRILLDRYGLKAEECVFLDDSRKNVDGAIAVGINGILYDDIARVRSGLSGLLK